MPALFFFLGFSPATTTLGAVGPAVNEGLPQGAMETPVCTMPMVGRHKTYEVGPGKAYTELDGVPFGMLSAGDVVNIYARAEPYRTKIGLRAQGTANAPVIVNGVSDEHCNKPVLDFAGARTAKGSANVFSSVQYGERLAGLIIKRGNGDDYNSYQPRFITIQGLKLLGARNGANYVTLAGGTDNYSSSACLWVQSGEDITIRNNDVSDCGFGIFLMAKDDVLSQTTLRVTIANNRVYNNGVSGSYSEHGFYVQAAQPIVEGNFIGVDRAGSKGSSYKSRSSGEIFRRNYVECTALCMDFVQSEEQANGIVKQPGYGTDYVYGNTIVSKGPPVVHYGGDNRGEQDQSEDATFVPPTPYRRHLRFWNNTFTLTTNTYRDNVFRLSALETEVDAWGNTFNFNFSGAGDLSWVDVAGTLRLGPGNVINGRKPVNGGQNSRPQNVSVVTVASPPMDARLSSLD